MSNKIIFNSEALFNFCSKILLKAGLSQNDADIVSDSLLFAELRNISSHGIVRLNTYIERIERGVMDFNTKIDYIVDEGAICLIDAHNGIGQVVSHNAMDKAIDIAEKYGIGMVVVRNSNHFGVASYYSMLASNKNMIGVAITNASPAIAPYGTKTPFIGTNPLTISIPASEEKPIVLDMAMSTVARGKIRLNALINKEIPLGWGLDADGNDTADANQVLKGSLVPIGGTKGSALALIIDILCGVLSDTCLTGEVKNITDMSGPSKTGHVFVAIDISKFICEDKFKENIDLIIKKIKKLPSIGEHIYMPGEIELNMMNERLLNGIPVEEEVVNSLNKLADRYGVTKL